MEVTYTDDIISDNSGETEILTFMTAMLANIEASLNHETELYDSGASRHVSPYCNKFLNFVSIKPKTIRAADGQEFEATGLGDMHIELPNEQSKSRILLKNVLYAPAMGLPWSRLAKSPKPDL